VLYGGGGGINISFDRITSHTANSAVLTYKYSSTLFLIPN